MRNTITLATLALLTPTIPALAHDAAIDHVHTQSGLVVYAVPAAILFAAAIALGLAVFVTRRSSTTNKKNNKS